MSIWNDMSWVPALRTPFLNQMFELITLMGYPLFLVMFLCFGYFALGSKRFFHTAMLLMAAGLVNSWLKDIGQDPRPAAEFALDSGVGKSYGWPSGHMQIAVVLWGYLAYSVRDTAYKNLAYWAAGIFIVLQGFSRLYLGVHDLGDVASGFVIGCLCLYAYISAQNHPRISSGIAQLPMAQAVGCLLALHLIYTIFYPSHVDHHAPIWFAGAMMGWLLGRYWMRGGDVNLPGPRIVQLLIASGLTGLSFVWMALTTRIPRALELGETGMAMPINYGFGILFGVGVIYVLPKLVSKITGSALASASA